MKLQLLLRKLFIVRFFAAMLLVGLVFGAAGVFILSQPDTDTVETSAEVLDITETYDSLRETYEFEVTISYTTADGQTYQTTCGYYHSGLKVGDTITIYYDPANPENISTPGSEIIPYVFAAVGGAIFLFALIRIITVLKTPLEETNCLDKVDKTAVSPELIDEIRNNGEEVNEYYFHYTQAFKQGYLLETPSRSPVFEAVSLKLAVLTKYQFNFINHLTHRETVKTVTHTVSTQYGNDSHSVVTDSHFKIDGVNCWQALGDAGYSLEPHLGGMQISFDVKKYGVEVATLEPAGTNIATGMNYKVGNIAAPGIFVVHCRESDVEGVFLACFCLARTFN